MSDKKEGIKLGFAILMLIAALVLSVFLLVHKFYKKTPKLTAAQIKENANFALPNFKENDCFLVSEKGTNLHPHYLKIIEKDFDKKRYMVLESIGNGKDQTVAIFINYYEEMKTFEKHRESCPVFQIK